MQQLKINRREKKCPAKNQWCIPPGRKDTEMNDANADESARKKDRDGRFRVELPILAQPDTACDQQKCDDDSCDLLGRHRVPPRSTFRRGVALPNQRRTHSYLNTKKHFVSPLSGN